MLIRAYDNATTEIINNLINDGDYKYLHLAPYKEYKQVEIKDDEIDTIQRISVDNEGRILGYFSANINQWRKAITSTYFVKFSYLDYYDDDIADKDFKQFVDMIMNHPIYKIVEFASVKENPANEIYEKIMKQYNGERFLLTNSVILLDGKRYDVWQYYFDRTKVH